MLGDIINLSAMHIYIYIWMHIHREIFQKDNKFFMVRFFKTRNPNFSMKILKCYKVLSSPIQKWYIRSIENMPRVCNFQIHHATYWINYDSEYGEDMWMIS